MKDEAIKGGIAGVGTIIAYLSGNFTPLIWLLIIFEIMDLVTGLYAAHQNKGLESKTAFRGFFKKICYFCLVAVAFGLDYMIHEATVVLHLNFNYPAMFGVLSVSYLLATEMISIVENLEKLGVSVPFVTTALKVVREKIEKMGGGDGSIDKEPEE